MRLKRFIENHRANISTCRFAEMDPAEKRQISHVRKALEKLRVWFEQERAD